MARSSAPGLGQVPLVIEDEEIVAQADLELGFLGPELLLGQLAGHAVRLDPLVSRSNRPEVGPDLELGLLFQGPSRPDGLLEAEPGLGDRGSRKDRVQRNVQGQIDRPVLDT